MKRLLRILTFLFVFVLASSVLVACVDMDENTVIGGITQEKISMQVFVTSDKIRVELNNSFTVCLPTNCRRATNRRSSATINWAPKASSK